MNYSSDMIIADLNEMSRFLDTAIEIKRELSYQIADIEKKFHAIENWDDDIHEKTEVVLETIDSKCEVVFDEIERLNKALRNYIDMLEDYNNPFSGKMGLF